MHVERFSYLNDCLLVQQLFRLPGPFKSHENTPEGNVPQPTILSLTHPVNLPTDNPSPTDLPVPVGVGVALAYPSPTHILHDALERPVRLAGSPDSGGYPTGCRGDSVTLRSPGNTPLGSTDGLVAQTRWGNPQGHVPSVLPGVRFATHEPAAVIQTVIHAPLFCTFSGVRIWQKSGETQW